MLSPFKPRGDAAPVDVPSIADVSPGYAQLLARREVLVKRRDAALVELRQIVKSDEQRESSTPSAVDIERRRRVDALVKGEHYEPRPVPLYEPQPSSRYWALQREISDIQDFALPEVDAELRISADAASVIIREKFRDEHRQMVRDIAAALYSLHELNVRYWAFSDAMGRKGVKWGALGAAFVRAAGHPADRQGPLGQWFREALADGHISKSEIPASLRP